MATSIGALIRRDVPPGDVVAHARAIQSGYDELWVVEDLPFAGGISQQSVILAATDTVAVGHGIAPAPFRNPAALAMEWATLAGMYPGRVIAGMGHGVQDWMQQLGERVASPLTLLKESTLAVRELLAGDEVTVSGRYIQLDGVQLEYPPSPVPKVLAGVRGPKSLLLAGAVADGTLLPEGHGPDDVKRARQLADLGREEAGRAGHHHLTVFAGFYVGEMDEIGEENPDSDPAFDWDAVSEDADEVTAKLQTLIDAGADSVVLLPFGIDVTQQLQLAAAEIVPKLLRS
jgi:alkanesulfonate monooxygenase SsuD/methylene tetrahydromethanopterin reductase-like flavin-dependent oxidoreductase (luciferase family)